MVVLSMMFQSLNVYWDSNSFQTSSGSHIYNPSLKMEEKWSAPCTVPKSTRFLLLCFISARVRLNQKWSTAVMFGLKTPNPHFPALIEFKTVYALLKGLNYFPCHCFLPTDTTLQVSLSLSLLLLFPWKMFKITSKLYLQQFKPL